MDPKTDDILAEMVQRAEEAQVSNKLNDELTSIFRHRFRNRANALGLKPLEKMSDEAVQEPEPVCRKSRTPPGVGLTGVVAQAVKKIEGMAQPVIGGSRSGYLSEHRRIITNRIQLA